MACVYILRSGSENLFKIGRTDGDVDARIRQLATGNPHRLTITPEELTPVICDAREFLAEFVAKQEEADRLSEEETDGVLLEPGDPEWSIASSLLAAREEEDTYRYQRQLLENKLKIAIGRSDGLDGIATWRNQGVERLGQAALKSAQPDIFRMYSKTSRMRVLRLI